MAFAKPKTFLAQIRNAYERFNYNNYRYRQYGLYSDDVIPDYPEVVEAVRRLPQHIKDERHYRCVCAAQISLMKQVLPEEQCPTYEEDLDKGHYLQPYLREVAREMKERAEWDSK